MKHTSKLILTPVYFIVTFFISSTFASDLMLTSNGKNAIFIELFTSQGCSSCPPAEKYINTFANKDGLWKKYIPIVFHVDYWDYIGWKDIFAKPEFGVRQRQYANIKKVRTVYTPAFVVDGAAWRRGFFNAVPQVQGLKSGELIVKITGNQVQANFMPSSSALSGDLKLNVAILGMGMVVNISAGENEGREAKHSFVVLGVSSRDSKTMRWQMALPTIKEHPSSKRYAVVAWISQPGNPSPVQAVAGWISHMASQ